MRIRGMRAWRDGWRVLGRDGDTFDLEWNPLSRQWTLYHREEGTFTFDASFGDVSCEES